MPIPANHVAIRVSATAPNATRTDIVAGRAQQFQLTCDEPPERHGNNEGMLPLEAFLGGYVACSHVIMNIIAAELGVVLRDLKLNAVAYLNPKGYMGIDLVKTPFSQVILNIEGNVSGDLSSLESLKAQLKLRCPAAATLDTAGTEIQEIWDLVQE